MGSFSFLGEQSSKCEQSGCQSTNNLFSALRQQMPRKLLNKDTMIRSLLCQGAVTLTMSFNRKATYMKEAVGNANNVSEVQIPLHIAVY